jgi:hypothetical protein
MRLPEALPERVLSRLGYRLLESKKTDLAISVFEQNVRAYPESLNAYDGLATALIAAGNTARALTQLRTAADVAQRTGMAFPAAMQKKLEALAATK